MHLKTTLETELHGTLTVTGTYIPPRQATRVDPPEGGELVDVMVCLESGEELDVGGRLLDRCREALWEKLENNNYED